MKVRIKQVDYASGLTFYYPQVKRGLFWRYFIELDDVVCFFPFYFYTETTLDKRKGAGITDLEYVKSFLKKYIKDYNCFVASRTVKKVVKITDF